MPFPPFLEWQGHKKDLGIFAGSDRRFSYIPGNKASDDEVDYFEFEFYSSVYTDNVMSSCSVNLLTLFLSKLSPLSC